MEVRGCQPRSQLHVSVGDIVCRALQAHFFFTPALFFSPPPLYFSRQGVEVVDAILKGSEETTFLHASVVNSGKRPLSHA